jgi:hypothetical protein
MREGWGSSRCWHTFLPLGQIFAQSKMHGHFNTHTHAEFPSPTATIENLTSDWLTSSGECHEQNPVDSDCSALSIIADSTKSEVITCRAVWGWWWNDSIVSLDHPTCPQKKNCHQQSSNNCNKIEKQAQEHRVRENLRFETRTLYPQILIFKTGLCWRI